MLYENEIDLLNKLEQNNIEFFNEPNNLDKLDELDELVNSKILKKIKISEKLKLLTELKNKTETKYIDILEKLMLLSYKDPKLKLICENQMYNPSNLLPYYTSYNDIDLTIERKPIGYGNTHELVSISIHNKYLRIDFINEMRLEIVFNDNFIFDIGKFNPTNIFEQIELKIGNVQIETIKLHLVDIIFMKNKLNWLYKSNKLIIPIPSEILGSKTNGIFMKKIKSNNEIQILITLSNTDYTKNINKIDCFVKVSNYSNYENLPLEKLPVKYNLDLFNYISSEPTILNYPIVSLNNIFSSNYYYYQYEDDNVNLNQNQNQNNCAFIRINFNNYVRGFYFLFIDENGQCVKENISFDIVKTQIDGCDHIILSEQMVLYKMKEFDWLNLKNCQNDIMTGIYYVDFNNFLNFNYINNFTFVLKNIKLGNITKCKINIYGLSAKTLVYLEGNIVKTM